MTAHLAGESDAGGPTLPDPARHSPYSDPGPWADLLAGLPDDVETLCAAARNVVVHYRAQLPELTEDRLPEVNSRWLHRIIGRPGAFRYVAADGAPPDRARRRVLP